MVWALARGAKKKKKELHSKREPKKKPIGQETETCEHHRSLCCDGVCADESSAWTRWEPLWCQSTAIMSCKIITKSNCRCLIGVNRCVRVQQLATRQASSIFLILRRYKAKITEPYVHPRSQLTPLASWPRCLRSLGVRKCDRLFACIWFHTCESLWTVSAFWEHDWRKDEFLSRLFFFFSPGKHLSFFHAGLFSFN